MENTLVYGYGDGTFTVNKGSCNIMCDKEGNIILKDGNHITKDYKRKDVETVKEWLNRNAVTTINGVRPSEYHKSIRLENMIKYLCEYYSERQHLKIGSIFSLARVDYMYEPFTYDRIYEHLSKAEYKDIRALYNDVRLSEMVNDSDLIS